MIRCEHCCFSKAMDQPRPRLCIVCGTPEETEKEPEKLYTINDLVAERQRAMDICWSFFEKHTDAFNSRTEAEQIVYGASKHQSTAWVEKERAEIARYCANAISGRTALNPDTPLSELALRDLKEKTNEKPY